MSELFENNNELIILSKVADLAKEGSDTISELLRDAYTSHSYDYKAIKRIIVFFKLRILEELAKIKDE